MLAVAAVTLTFVGSYEINSENIVPGTFGIIDTSKWFHKEYDDRYDNQRIAARKPHIAYFLNMRLYPFPMVDRYDSLIALLRRDSVKFLYYGAYEASDRSQFADLINGHKQHTGLKSLCIVVEPNASAKPMSVLYEVTK